MLKNIFISALALIGFTERASAQNLFDEMVYSPQQTIFHLNAPTKPTVRIYADGEGGTPVKTIKMKADGTNRWKVVVPGDLKGKFYTFDLVKAKKGLSSSTETAGTFAKAVGVNGHRGAIIDMRDTDPEGWSADASQSSKFKVQSSKDLVFYEMHFRDFSISTSSGLRHHGKYLALTEPKAIDYLKDLGVTAIHILPSFDYASVDEANLARPQYNWGYDPLNYNVPEGSYATNPYNPTVRIHEFKEMVQALHNAGIKVILDVVYNHTFDIKGSGFQRTFPDVYYRKNADGTYSNGSGCGNETASDQPLMREFMLESVKYWIQEYHIDGFRFDLMGVHDIETMNLIREEVNKINPNIFIYGEGWSAGACALDGDKLATKAHIPQMPGIAAFSDDLRDALRGPFSDDTKGAFLAGLPGSEESLKAGIAGMIAHPQVDYSKVNYSKEPWAKEPTQMISYVSCHDDMCLTDRLRASIPGIKTDELIRLDQLAQTVVFLSQGVPFMLSGEEMLRDKKGVHNSFNSPDSINHLNWNNLQQYPQVYQYYKNLIQLRRAHPAFRMGKASLVQQNLTFLPTQSCLVGFHLNGKAVGDSWSDIYVIYNSNREARGVTLPDGTYSIAACDGTINEAGLGEMKGGTVTVDPQSALILFKK